MEQIYNKLVRDKIPNIIIENGETPIIKMLSEITYKKELEKKLYEEYQEVLEETGDNRIEELTDMLEVIKSLAKLEGKTIDDVVRIANDKNKKRGAFEERIFLEKVVSNK